MKSNHIDFTLHKEYNMLLKQAKALHKIVECTKQALSHYMDKDYSMSSVHLEELENSLESEKAMNAILTEELEELRENSK